MIVDDLGNEFRYASHAAKAYSNRENRQGVKYVKYFSGILGQHEEDITQQIIALSSGYYPLS